MKAISGQQARTHSMYMVHTIFRREFALMPGLIRSAAAGDRQRANVVTDHIELVTSLLHYHHHGEDRHLWPKLLVRGSEEVAPLVRLMESQHERIDGLSAELNEARINWRAGADVCSRELLANAVERITPLLVEHMNTEESRILPLIEKYVTAAEWDLMIRDAVAEARQEDIPVLLGMAIYEGDPDDVEDVISLMPPEMQPVIKELAEQAFASHAKAVYGTANPPRIKQIVSRAPQDLDGTLGGC